jgi:hypothetical protein
MWSPARGRAFADSASFASCQDRMRPEHSRASSVGTLSRSPFQEPPGDPTCDVTDEPGRQTGIVRRRGDAQDHLPERCRHRVSVASSARSDHGR